MSEINPKKELYTQILILLAGLGLAFLAVREYNSTGKLISGGVKTKATIIEVIIQREKNTNLERNSDERNYIPVFEFTDQSGKILKVKGEETNSPEFQTGETVEILYNPSNSNEVRTTTFFGIHGRALLFAGFATFCFGSGLWFFLFKRKSNGSKTKY